MSDPKICRICLSRGVKMYNYKLYHLKQYYEQVLTEKVNDKDGLPHHFCYECAAMLYKFHKFKEKCHAGQGALKRLLWSGPITFTTISQVDRQSKNFKSTIDILYVSKRVKTYNVKNKSISKSLLDKINLPEIEEIKVVYDSDSSLDSKNLAEIKHEIINKEEAFESKANIDNDKIHTENVFSDIEDDRIYSEDDDTNLESANAAHKIVISGEDFDNQRIFVKEEISHNTEVNDNAEKTVNENHNVKKNKKNEKSADAVSVKEKVKRFEIPSTKNNYLDPAHWLKINLNEEEALEEFRARAHDPKFLAAAYHCTDCLKGFSKEDMLNRHIKLRHSESIGPIECRFCNMRFKWKCYLTRHITQHYTKYKCLRCDLMCPLKNTALFHNEYHNGVIRKCMHCGEEFRHLSTYYTHLRSHRSEHVCTLCGASFVSNIGLNMHKRTMHVNTVINPEEEANTYCERCDIRFETRKAFEEHLFHSAMHTEGVEDLADETPAPSNPKRRKKILRRNPRKFTPCTICNRNFSTQTAYMKHHIAEHKSEPFPSKDGERHICEICGASLAAGSVASHLNTHTREKLHACITCGMQFNSKGSMTRHQLTHTGEKPYVCTLCDKRFTQKCSMKLHYRTFHLKEPYPKRNRRKKEGSMQEPTELEHYRIHEDDSNKILR